MNKAQKANQRTAPVTWQEMVDEPKGSAIRILANQVKDRNDFIRQEGLWIKFQTWLHDG